MTLSPNERNFRTIFRNNPDVIMLVKKDGTIFDVNRLSKGFTKEMVIGQSIFDEKWYETKDQVKVARKLITYVIQTGKEEIYESSQISPDGSLSLYETRVFPFEYDNEGNLISFQCSTREITESTRMEEELKNIFNLSPDMQCICTPEGKFIKVNRAYEKVLGYTTEEILKLGWAELVHPDDIERTTNEVQKQLKGNDVANFINRFRCKDGTYKTLEWQASPVINGVVYATARDITERKKTEDAFHQSEKRFRELAELLPVGVYEVDLEQNVTYVNRRGLEFYGYSQEDLEKGLKTSWMMIPEDFPRALKVRPRLLRGEKSVGFEYTALRADGTTFQVYTQTDGIMHDGELVGLRGMVMDITERKQIENTLRESEKRFRELADLLPSGIFELDIDGYITYVNRSGLDLFGYTREDIEKGLKSQQTVIPEEYDRVLKNRQSMLRGEKVSGSEYIGLRKNGTTFNIFVYMSPIIRKDRIVGLRGIAIDITERKQAELEIGNLAKFPSENPNPVLRIGRNGVILYGNVTSESWLNKWGSQVGEFVPKPWTEHIMDVLSSGKMKEVEFKHENKVFSFDFTPVVAADYVNVYGRDITERKKAYIHIDDLDDKLRKAEYDQLWTVYSQSIIPTLILSKGGKIVDYNEAMVKLTGYTHEEIHTLDSWMFKLYPDEEYRNKVIEISRASRGRIIDVIRDEFIITRKDGQKHYVEFSVYDIFHDGTPLDLQIVQGVNITERKNVEEALRESEAIYRSLVETSPQPIMLSTPEGKIINVNMQAAKLFGFKNGKVMLASGKNIFDFISSEYQQKALESMKKIIEDGRIRGIEFTMLKEDGFSFPVEMNVSLIRDSEGVPKSVIGVLRDLTEHKRMEQQLLEAKRFATIGETAGMVGHDLRNPLQAIVNTIYLANMKVKSLPDEATEKGEIRTYLETIDRQVNYMNKIVSDLLDYARPIHLELTEINILQLIQGTLLSMDIPEIIDVSVTVPKKMKLKIDPTLMRRVLINLITNAMQAMPDGGKLAIKSSKKAGDGFISVKDTGVGIHDKDLPKIFQPLFTTKSKGQGFGLSVCKKIIDAHNGEIIVKSKVGKGSTFTVKIPLKD